MMVSIKKYLNKETIMYLIFGVLTTVVDYAVSLAMFYIIGFEEVTSNNIAWVIAVAFAYITNKLFVFQSRSFKLKVILWEIVTFASARVITLVITDIFLVIAKKINLEFALAKILISIVVVLLNYVFSKLFIFKKPEGSK